MADDGDQAQRVETFQRDVALEAMRRHLSHLAGPGREDCENCGCDIPDQRRRALPGATRCVQCQTIRDRSHTAGR